jgi:hypothetical protein
VTISWRRIFHCDVLVVDVIGAGWLRHCLPSHLHVEALDIRTKTLFLLDLGFFYLFLMSTLFSLRIQTGRLGYARINGLLQRIFPKLSVSCADNNPLLARHAMENPKTPAIFIQNALRDTKGWVKSGQDLSIYLAFDETEREIFRALEITCKEYQPIGSIKLGLALSNQKDGRGPQFDVAFISHYRPEMFGSETPSLQQHIESCQRRLLNFCCSYLQDQALSFTVITKTRDPELQVAEQEYYTNLSDNIPLHSVYADKGGRALDSYSAGLSSDLVIHPGSTQNTHCGT